MNSRAHQEYIIHANVRMRDNVALVPSCGHDKLISDPFFPRHRCFVSSCNFPREQKLKLSKMCSSTLVDILFYWNLIYSMIRNIMFLNIDNVSSARAAPDITILMEILHEFALLIYFRCYRYKLLSPTI